MGLWTEISTISFHFLKRSIRPLSSVQSRTGPLSIPAMWAISQLVEGQVMTGSNLYTMEYLVNSWIYQCQLSQCWWTSHWLMCRSLVSILMKWVTDVNAVVGRLTDGCKWDKSRQFYRWMFKFPTSNLWFLGVIMTIVGILDNCSHRWVCLAITLLYCFLYCSFHRGNIDKKCKVFEEPCLNMD